MTTRVALAAATAVAVAAGIGVALWTRDEAAPPPPAINGYVLTAPRPLPAVELVVDDDERFVPSRFAGHWSFLYFGYTYCPDICPLALLELASVKERLAALRNEVRVEYYLVSVDPGRDTPARLKEYVQYFDPAFHGLTGPTEALFELARAAESLFFIPPGQDADNYLVSHSNNFALLNPEGKIQAIFTPPHTPEQVAADFLAVVAGTGSR
jgi:protein SCO1/2